MTPVLAIHDPDCSTWDAPAESGADHLVAVGYQDERVAVYLSTLRPIYDAMKRCLGQMAGLLLLLQTGSLDPHRAGVSHHAMHVILVELSDRLRALRRRKARSVISAVSKLWCVSSRPARSS